MEHFVINMWKQTAITIIASILLSVSVTLLVERYTGHTSNDTVRVKKLELVDEHGAVKGVLEVHRSQDGEQWPQLTLLNDAGRDAIVLGVGPRGGGNLVFNNYDSPGFPPLQVINLGYIMLDDTVPHSPSMTGWGLAVSSYKGGTVMGISDSGKLLGLSSLQSGAPHDPSR
jgi:hypothetical protein